ncbi:hypothetical protein N7E81_10125 [Reichenbachiella carrageenanivorans]|uniref:Cyclic nucleotide-binding domain-containing protein n=1 Tax=Reichenbachiella carrageenanivorans TaxID=2979869 RepID=A0ABY6CUX2_9BACT|nr:hypothetical protein [Reichenbachiella carrageenanivorans]UXX77725.1 hypothetical protein N7E81_10125 [Reichenbachiella carrageenanivorans]
MKTNLTSTSRLKKRLWYVNAIGFGLGIFLTSSYISTISIFIDQFEISALPLLLVETGAIGILTALTLNYCQKRYSTSVISTIYLLTISILYFFLHIEIIELNHKEFNKLVVLVLLPVSTTAIALYQSITNALMDIRERKAYAPKLNIGIILGSISIASSLVYIAHLQGEFFDNIISLLLLTASGSCFLSIIVIRIVSFKNQSLRELQWSAQFIKYHTRIKKLIKNKYFIALSLFTLCVTISTLSFNSLFLFSLKESGKSMIEVYTFFAQLLMSVVVLTFIFLIVSKSQVIRQYGVKLSLTTIPFAVCFFTFVSLIIGSYYSFNSEELDFILFFIFLVTGIAIVSSLTIGLQRPLFELFFSPIEEALRENTLSLTQGIIKHMGVLITGLLLLLLAKLESSSAATWLLTKVDGTFFPWTCSLIVLAGGILWLFSLAYMYRLYTDLLQKSLGEQNQLIKHEHSFNQSIISKLENEISNNEFPLAIYQLNLLKVMDPKAYRDKLVFLADHNDENIQEYAVTDIAQYQLIDAAPVLSKVTLWKHFPNLRTSSQVKHAILTLEEGNKRIKQTKYIDQLTSSKLEKERVYGALLAQHIKSSKKGEILNRLFGDHSSKIIFNAILSAVNTDDTVLQNNLIQKLNHPIFVNASMSAIAASQDAFVEKLETAFQLGKLNQKLQQRILQVYGKIGSEQAVTLLLDKLSYPNQNVVTTCLDALSRCGFTVTNDKMALQVRSELHEVCNVVIWNMSIHQDAIRHQSDRQLTDALDYEITFNYNTIFRLLALLYDPKSVESVKNNIDSHQIEESEFASQLLDIFIYDEMKLFLIPLFKRSSYAEKVKELMNTFPTEPMGKSELLINVIQRDYKWINSWTKTCALRELSKISDFDSSQIMAAHLINPNPVLSETAAQSLYELHKPLFESIKVRYEKERDFQFAHHSMQTVENQKNNQDNIHILKYDIISFIRKIPEFKDIPGLVLSEMTRYVKVKKHKKGDLIFEGSISNLDYYIVYEGSIELNHKKESLSYFNHEMAHRFFLTMPEDSNVKLHAISDAILMQIDNVVFHELLTFYEEIPNSILASAPLAKTSVPANRPLLELV